MPPFAISHFEIQLTATNDGQFFRQHKDDDADSVRTRVLTFVYYFYREPKAFRGGALQLYDAQLDPQGNVSAGLTKRFTPRRIKSSSFPATACMRCCPWSVHRGRSPTAALP